MRPVRQDLNATMAPLQHSPWHSPVPYLFGGLAAMLGLIAFALLILACSYWKLSGYLDNGENGENDPETGKEKTREPVKAAASFETKVVVIMAGDEKPTYLATPISSGKSVVGESKVESEKVALEEETQKGETQNPSQ